MAEQNIRKFIQARNPVNVRNVGKLLVHVVNLPVSRKFIQARSPVNVKECGKAFRLDFYLIEHRRIHTGSSY